MRSVTEARDGALALLIKLGSVDHAVLPAAESLIDEAARTVFGYGDKLVEHRTFAEYVARNTPSFSVLFRELVPPLFEKQLAAESKDLIDLVLQGWLRLLVAWTPARREMLDEVQASFVASQARRASRDGGLVTLFYFSAMAVHPL